jgi:hypothetical protein
MKWMRLQILWIAFVMLVMGFVFWRISLAWRVNRETAAIRRAGQPTTWPELDKWYKAVPDSENAALVLTQTFALRCTFPDQRSNQLANVYIPSCGPRLPPDMKQLLVDYLDLNRPALARMREALKLSKCRFPITLSPDSDQSHLAKLKGIVLDLRYEAILAMESGQTGEATAAIEDILKLAKTLDEEPPMISQLVRNAIIEIAARTVERCLNTAEFKAKELKILLAALTAAENTAPLVRGLVGECVGDTAIFHCEFGGLKKSERVAQQGIRLSGYFERSLPHYLQIMASNIVLASKGPPRWLAAAKQSADLHEEFVQRNDFFDPLSSAGRYFYRATAGFACIRMATAALAIEQLRTANEPPPEKLDELKPKYFAAVPADPFDGVPLRYRRLQQGYLLYSTGGDLHDDGGRETPRSYTNAGIYPSPMASTDTVRRRYGFQSNGPPPEVAPASWRSSKTTNTVALRLNSGSNSLNTNAPARVTYDLTFTVER